MTFDEYIPKSAARVIDRVLDDLIPTVDYSPRIVDEAREIVLDQVHAAICSYKKLGTVPLAYLSGEFFNASRDLNDGEDGALQLAAETFEGLAQTVALLTGQRGSKFYLRALDESRYGRG